MNLSEYDWHGERHVCSLMFHVCPISSAHACYTAFARSSLLLLVWLSIRSLSRDHLTHSTAGFVDTKKAADIGVTTAEATIDGIYQQGA